MSYDSSDCLVDGAGGLLVVPRTSRQLLYLWLLACFQLSVEVIFFQNDFCIVYLWVRDADDDHCSRCIIREIKAFAYFSSANGHEDGSLTFLAKNGSIISIYYHLVLAWILRFFQHLLLFYDFTQNTVVLPLFIASLHQAVWRKEHQNPTRRYLSKPCHRVPQIKKHIHIASILIAEIESFKANPLLQDTDLHLLWINHMWAFYLLLKLYPTLCLERVQRR